MNKKNNKWCIRFFINWIQQWLSEIKIVFGIHLLKYLSHDILIGSYFNRTGGVSIHIQNIKNYSSLRIATLPEKDLSDYIRKYRREHDFKSKIEQLELRTKIIHSHVDPWFIEISKKHQERGLPWVHTYHTLYFEQDWKHDLHPWQLAINNALLNIAKSADVKIAVSKWLQNFLLNEYQIDSIYIPNGLNVKKCDAVDRVHFTKKYRLQNFILYTGGLQEIKNPKLYIELATTLSQWEFVMIGKGLSREGIIEELSMSIPENLNIFGELVHSEVLEAVAACRVFVMTSHSEGLPTAMMEAMALERSVVGCDTYGIKEVIHSKKYGYLYESNNLNDLIEQTKKAYFDTSRCKSARERILENYDWSVVIPKLDAVYKNLLKRLT